MWWIIILLAIIVDLTCTCIIFHEFWEIFKDGSIKDKILMFIITLLFLVALFCGSLFVKTISAEWDQSPILAIPLLFVLFTYNVKYILSVETDNNNNPRSLLKHYFYLFKIFGLAYVVVILGYVGLNNRLDVKMSSFDSSLIFILCTFAVFVACYFLSYGFIVFAFTKGKHIHESRCKLSKDIKQSDNKFPNS